MLILTKIFENIYGSINKCKIFPPKTYAKVEQHGLSKAIDHINF